MYHAQRGSFPNITKDNASHDNYYYDVNDHHVFKTDDSTALLTDDDLAQYPDLVRAADIKEIKA